MNIGVPCSNIFVTSKFIIFRFFFFFFLEGLSPLISNICGELGSCCEIRCTSMAERGRMPCETQMAV